MQHDLEFQVKTLLEEKHPFIDLSDDTDLLISNEFDELDLIEFVIDLEDHFGIEIKDAQLEGVQTFQDLIVLTASEIRVNL